MPALYIVKTKKDAMTEKWKYSAGPVEDLTDEKVRGFINDFRNGTAERIYKSERVPEKESGPKEIRKIVGKTWEKNIMDPKNEYFVAIISEFCRACRDLQASWEQLA